MLYRDAVECLENLIEDAHHNNDKTVEFGARSLIAKIMRSNVRVFLQHGPRLTDGLTREEASFASVATTGNGLSGKIQAIKLYRERTKSGLKEAKDAVEAWMQKHLGSTSIYNPPQNDSSCEPTFDRY